MGDHDRQRRENDHLFQLRVPDDKEKLRPCSRESRVSFLPILREEDGTLQVAMESVEKGI